MPGDLGRIGALGTIQPARNMHRPMANVRQQVLVKWSNF